MDSTGRGSRRARHVASRIEPNTHGYPSGAAFASDALSPPGAPIPAPRQRPTVTPDAHRTPDQPPEGQQRAPPPNPFRLHRIVQMPFFTSPPRRPGKRPRYTEDQLDLPPPPRPILRVPLQELRISPTGALLHFRERLVRPIPSEEKENAASLQMLRDCAIVALDAIIRSSIADLGRFFEELESARRDENLFSTTSANESSAAQPAGHPRLSIPLLDSDESDSEPDLSILGMARSGTILEQPMNVETYDDEIMSQGQYEAEETSVEEGLGEDEEPLEDEDDDIPIPLIDPATAGLKEISNLGKFTVSSHKQGNGVEELRSDDLKLYWQSDGPQPHKLTIYFVKRVGIRDIRFFVDYNEDESYTPTKISFKSGTSENNLLEFATMNLDSPVGWQQVPLTGTGGDPDGNTLVSYVFQMQILENHQNGKDTHLRGIKIYAFDADSTQGAGRENNPVNDAVELVEDATAKEDTREMLHDLRRQSGGAVGKYEPGDGGLKIPDFMREPEIR